MNVQKKSIPNSGVTTAMLQEAKQVYTQQTDNKYADLNKHPTITTDKLKTRNYAAN